ncbi:MAG: hypothetical protein EOM80_00985 [Erysipelotrichia bacterium]|nr:hypothetical protein [Erysipelotrichia bacterium]
MKSDLFKVILLASAFSASGLMASPEGDLKYLGYSQDMIDQINATALSEPAQTEEEQQATCDEVEATTEQLSELGATRSLTPALDDRSGEIRDEVLTYWEQMTPSPKQIAPLSPELKASIEANIRAALESKNYNIIQLDLVDLPEGSLQNDLRAVIRVSRPLKTRNSYKEIQGNLSEIKSICIEAATIEDTAYLSELTTFVAENPRNNYYYEKTILNP